MEKFLGTELIPKVIDLINADNCLPSVATTDSDGKPRILFMSVRATDSKTIRLAFNKSSKSLQNILIRPNVCLSIAGEGNVALTINGRTEKIRESKEYIIFELKIDSILSKRSAHIIITKGTVTKTINKEGAKQFYKMLTD